MILKTGIKGFTLIEVMVATCVLALGAVMLYEAFFVSWDAFEYCDNYLYVATLADEKIWEAQDALKRTGTLDKVKAHEQWVISGRRFNCNISNSLVNDVKDMYKLFRIDLAVSWQQARRPGRLTRTAYAMFR